MLLFALATFNNKNGNYSVCLMLMWTMKMILESSRSESCNRGEVTACGGCPLPSPVMAPCHVPTHCEVRLSANNNSLAFLLLPCNSIYLHVKLTFRPHWRPLSVCQFARKYAAFTFHRDPVCPGQYILLPGKCDIQTNGAGDCWLRILLMFYISRHKPQSVLAAEYAAYQQGSDTQPDNCTGF